MLCCGRVMCVTCARVLEEIVNIPKLRHRAAENRHPTLGTASVPRTVPHSPMPKRSRDLHKDLRIHSVRPLRPPAALMEEIPLNAARTAFVAETRSSVAEVLHGLDDRVLVVVGPCSIHDPLAVLDYAGRLHE